MWLTPNHIFYYDRNEFPEFPYADAHTWPASGDVAIDLPNASRPAPQGTCGAHVIVALHFEETGHVAKITEHIMPLACL
jgi:hypothetical protein